jgi:hypothetical protein
MYTDAGASPTHQASQRGSEKQLDEPAHILKILWDCCAKIFNEAIYEGALVL